MSDEGRGRGEPAVDAFDDAVPDERPPAADVLEDDSRLMPWIGVLFAVCAVLLVPWVFYIGFHLPARQLSRHYDVAWAGFDVGLFVALAFTAYGVLRRAHWMGMSAGAGAALLVTDVWFDVVTAPTRAQLGGAVAMAALVELPLAAICVWLCEHARELDERRTNLLLRRRPR